MLSTSSGTRSRPKAASRSADVVVDPSRRLVDDAEQLSVEVRRMVVIVMDVRNGRTRAYSMKTTRENHHERSDEPDVHGEPPCR
jgi:hypothetical protein